MADDLEGITRFAESRNRDYDRKGRPIRSKAGALYAMQVLPSTARDPGFGVKPAASDQPGEYNRVGRDLITTFNQRYGDPKAAWAAYNWGPGRVDRLRAAHGPDWYTHVPAEVRRYADTNASKLSAKPATDRAIIDGPPGESTGALPGNIQAKAMDEDTSPLSAAGGGQQSALRDLSDTQSEIQQLQEDAAAQRKARYEAGLAAIQRKQYGPSSADKLAMWSEAFLSPTRVPGFKGLMMNIAPMMGEMARQRVAAEGSRNDALAALEDKYGGPDIAGRSDALKLKLEALRASGSLLKQPQTEYSSTATGVIFNKRTGFAMPSASHVQALLQNPGAARDFDIKFGPGSAKEVLTRYGGGQQ